MPHDRKNNNKMQCLILTPIPSPASDPPVQRPSQGARRGSGAGQGTRPTLACDQDYVTHVLNVPCVVLMHTLSSASGSQGRTPHKLKAPMLCCLLLFSRQRRK